MVEEKFIELRANLPSEEEEEIRTVRFASETP